FQSAQELADELGRFLRGEPIHARPVSQRERFWRWARRNPLPTGLALGLALVFVLGFAGVLWQWQRADNFARTEGRQRARAEDALAHMEAQKAEELFQANDSA